MKEKKINAVEVWKELEDELAPRLKLNPIERTVYAHLLRHWRLEGKVRLQFSIPWLASSVGVSDGPARAAMRWLLPSEIPAPRVGRTGAGGRGKLQSGANLEEMDFLRTRPLRQAIHAREGGLCFYCLRRTPGRAHCLDHVVPLAEGGSNSYRNLVSCCLDCNSRKRDVPAADLLRRLFREGRLSAKDLSARLRAVQALAAGKLRPPVSSQKDVPSERGKENNPQRANLSSRIPAVWAG